MPRPTRHLTDGEVPADLHQLTPHGLLHRTFTAIVEHTDVHPDHDRANVQVAACAGLVTGTPSATTGSQAVQ